MTGEAIVVRSAYGTAQAAQGSTVSNGSFSTGTVTAVASISGITGDQKDFVLLDFRFQVTSGTPTANQPIHIYRRPGDGTNQGPLPSAYESDQFVGMIQLDNAASSYGFLYGVQNVDQNDTFYWLNDNDTAIDGVLSVRTRSAKEAA